MANTENIEAKLCAYIDGDLDAAGRAEIEKHLAANPQHRGLIEQLARQRDLLRDLPRESAPEEIIDALQSHMERSVLLGDADGAHGPETIKISRWPQFMAAAAIVAITVGLGAVIYFVLPQGGGGADYAAVVQPGARLDGDASTIGATGSESATPSATATAEERGDRERVLSKSGTPLVARAEADEAKRGNEDMAPVAAAPAAPGAPVGGMKKAAEADIFAPSVAGIAGGGAGSSIALSDLQAAQDQLQNAELARQLKDAPGGLNDNAVFVVVSTADANAARSQVTNYLASNNISWDAVTHPVPEFDLGEDQAANLSRSQRTTVQMKTADTTSGQVAVQQPAAAQPTSPGKSAAKSEVSEGEQPKEQQDKLDATAQRRGQQEPYTREKGDAATATGAASGVADAGPGAGPSPEVMSNAASPNVALQEAAAQAQRELGQPPEKQLAQQQQQQAPVPAPAQQQVSLRSGGSGPEARLIIARGMTKQQAQELSSNLSKQTPVQRAAVYDQKLKVSTPQRIVQRSRDAALGAPTSRPSDESAAAAGPTTAPANEQRAAAPTTAPTDVGALQSTGAGVTATPGAAQPALAPTTTTAPAPLPLAAEGEIDQSLAAGPTTMPAEAVVPDDQPVDVVILLQDDVPSAAAVQQQVGGEQQQQVQQPGGEQQQRMEPADAVAPNAAPTATEAPQAEQAPATQPKP